MANTLGIKRRIGSTQAAPTGANNEGELALYFPGVAGDTTTPTLYANDGGGWRIVNQGGGVSGFDITKSYNTGDMVLQGNNIYSAPGAIAAGAFTPASWTKITNTVTPTVVGLNAGADQGSVFATFNADGITVVPGEIAIYTYNGTAYVYTGPTGAPVVGANAAQFTALGAATAFATAGDVTAGLNQTNAINPKLLRDELVRAFGPVTAALFLAGTAAAEAPDANPANDAHKLVALDASGHINPAFLNLSAVVYKGTADLTAAPTGAALAPQIGDLYFNNASGTVNAGWVGITGNVKSGDIMIFDGAKWNHVTSELDLTGVALFNSGVDITAAPTAGLVPGSIYKVGTAGTPNAGWTGLGPVNTANALKTGDVLIWDGAGWTVIPGTPIDPADFIPKDGPTTTGTSFALTMSAAAGTVVLDGGTNVTAIDNFTIDGGTY